MAFNVRDSKSRECQILNIPGRQRRGSLSGQLIDLDDADTVRISESLTGEAQREAFALAGEDLTGVDRAQNLHGTHRDVGPLRLAGRDGERGPGLDLRTPVNNFEE